MNRMIVRCKKGGRKGWKEGGKRKGIKTEMCYTVIKINNW